MKKKPDFRKLALLGITGGVMFASNVSAEETNTYNQQQLLAGKCGGRNGCGGAVAYQPRGSCGAAQPPAYYTNQPSQSCNAGQQPAYYTSQPSHSCNAGQAPAYYTSQPSHSCNAARPQAYYTDVAQPAGYPTTQPQNPNQPQNPAVQPGQNPKMSAGCGAKSNPRTAQNSYSQWDQVADNGKNGSGAYSSQQDSPSDSQVLSQLNEEGKLIYKGLDTEGKALAQKLVNQTCKGQNDCKGLNSCKSKDNSCAGKGSCRNTSPGPFKDKNQAVKVAAQKMAEKRAGAGSARY